MRFYNRARIFQRAFFVSFSGANIGPSAVRKVTSILRLAFGWKPENEHIRPVDTISGYLVNEKPVSSSSRFGGERTLERIRRRKGVANFFLTKKNKLTNDPTKPSVSQRTRLKRSVPSPECVCGTSLEGCEWDGRESVARSDCPYHVPYLCYFFLLDAPLIKWCMRWGM